METNSVKTADALTAGELLTERAQEAAQEFIGDGTYEWRLQFKAFVAGYTAAATTEFSQAIRDAVEKERAECILAAELTRSRLLGLTAEELLGAIKYAIRTRSGSASE